MLTSKSPFYIFLGILLLNTPLLAQMATDGTLGKETNLTGPNFEIPANLGQQLDGNLFHSFKEFNINMNESATFMGPDSVQNILARVTGGHHSWIDGTLKSEISHANLYLLNPSGIVFGENAKLDVLGSFHASTAEVLHFQDGGHFNATEPGQSLLTVASPEAFGFLSNQPANISIQGNSDKPFLLEVRPEQTLSFIGGDLTIQNSILLAPSGRINLVAMASAGKVFHTTDNLAITALGGMGQISLSQSNYELLEQYGLANLDVSGREDGIGQGGHIAIRAGQLVLDQGRIFADTYSEIGKGIDIDVADKISLENSAWISASNRCQRDCENTKGGDIIVKARHLSLSGRNEGYIDYLYQRYLQVYTSDEISGEEAEAGAYAEAYRVSQSRIDTNNYSSGRGGNISIQAEILEMGPGVLETMNDSKEAGPVGNIEVHAQRMILTEGGNLNSSTHSAAKGGQITVNSSELSLFGSSFITASTDSSGAAGDIELNTQRLTLSGSSFIKASTYSSGAAGDIELNTQRLTLSGSSFIMASTDSSGAAGDIELNTQRLTLEDSWISGNSNLEAENAGNAGNAGKIDIQANEMSLVGTGDENEGNSSITTQSMAAGGGDIVVDVGGGNLWLRNSFISASAQGNKPEHIGGNITISHSKWLILEKRSALLASAKEGHGGKIGTINARYLLGPVIVMKKWDPDRRKKLLLNNSVIDATSEKSVNGEVEINGQRWEPNIPMTLLKFAENNLSLNRCAYPDRSGKRSYFLINARDILPRSPEDLR